MKSLLKHLSPFAPDQSGAVSALFDALGKELSAKEKTVR